MVCLIEIFVLLFITTSNTVSYRKPTVGTNVYAEDSDKLVVEFHLDKQQTSICPHGYCNAKTLALIQSQIASRFGSKSFSLTVKLSNGNVITITAVFCSYGTSKTLNE